MANKSGDIGTKTETAIVKYAQKNGFPHADRLTKKGNKDRGDVMLVQQYVMAEVKGGHAAENASIGQIRAWMQEAAVERRNGDWAIAFLITKRKGAGYDNPQSWWAHWWLSDLAALRGCDSELLEEIRRTDGLVRMHLEDALRQLRWGGFGTPPGEEDPA